MKDMTRQLLFSALLLGLNACGGSEEPASEAGAVPNASPGELEATRRDVRIDQVPERVNGALETKFPGWRPDRIIESDRGDGVMIYEFFGKDEAGKKTRIEIRWAEGHAELLIDERLR